MEKNNNSVKKSEIVVLVEELKRMREESERKWNEHIEEDRKKWNEYMEDRKRWNEHMEEDKKKWNEYMEEDRKKWNEYMEEDRKRWNEHKIEYEKLIQRFNKSLSKLGARIGVKFEGVSREFIRLYLKKNGINKNRITKFKHFDTKGEVFGYPSDIEVDVFVKEPLVIGEVKSIIEAPEDIYTLKKKVNYIEKLFNKKAKLAFIAAIDIDELKKKDINNACKLTEIKLITS